ncbi:uncharacterized protein LOC112554044 isoform X2 [Pomacea canaliculata]|uniref:uncharacterized protein LOC112554044 isoform X2 n=1 Tax=Pomacea canaliculata TaxID=400727 RepID=UPI000D738FC6|nr:uncharacterized protein LOC112554044 isoform X2 [Pomacea canaliculata]
MSKQLGLAFKAQLLPDAIPTIFQHNEIARKRKKDLSDGRVSLAKRLQHKQTMTSQSQQTVQLCLNKEVQTDPDLSSNPQRI